MIHHETDGLLKIYRGYSYLLRPYVEVAEETAPTIIANDNEIRDCVTQLLQALKDFDIDLCDQLIAQLKTYQLDSRTSQLLIDLEPVNTELNYDLGCQIIQQFLNANF